MKHIRKFNESYFDYYQEIDHNQYQQMIGMSGVRMGANKEEMTDDDKSQIKELLLKKGIMDRQFINLPSTDRFEFDKSILTGKHQLFIEYDLGKNMSYPKDIIINKVKDEWFLVALHYKTMIKGHSYKCDQLDGLLHFLDEKIPNKKL